MSGRGGSEAARAERLAAKLRENLRRRKAQAQEIADPVGREAGDETPGERE